MQPGTSDIAAATMPIPSVAAPEDANRGAITPSAAATHPTEAKAAEQSPMSQALADWILVPAMLAFVQGWICVPMTGRTLEPNDCVFLACTATPASSQEDAIAVTTHTIENHLTEEISRKWYGGETVCLFGPHQDNRAGLQIGPFLEAVNRAYGSEFKLTKAPWHGSSTASWHEGCQAFTTIYVMVGAPVGAETLVDNLESLGGSRPPRTYIARNHLAEARGITLRIPGNRRREFVYVNDTVPPVSSNPDPVWSIMIEEMTHALTTLGDFETVSTVSVRGKMPDVAYYDGWLDSNPRGFCLADLILREMQVGRTVGQLSHRGASLGWLRDHARTLSEFVPVLQARLSDVTDQRCQG